MPPRNVCPQSKAAVPVRRKMCERCDHVFKKAKCNLQEKAMKRTRDSVKSAKGKLHKTACERASEICDKWLITTSLHNTFALIK